MVRLMREVRFFRTEAPDSVAGSQPRQTGNNWAGTAPGGVALPFWLVRIVVEGPADPQTGYVCDIRVLDDIVHAHLGPKLDGSTMAFNVLGGVLTAAASEMERRLPTPLRLALLQLRLSPFTFLGIGAKPSMILLTQSYEFSASHRLSCAGLSDEENHRLFGKCSNPHGHGHNYLLEVTVEAEPRSVTFNLVELDRRVRGEVIDRFDHRNLNVECSDFSGLNPTVENIAQVIFNLLSIALAPMRLAKVRVWETGKTYAECLGNQATLR